MNLNLIFAFAFILAAAVLSGISLFRRKEDCIVFVKYALWLLIFAVLEISLGALQ